MASDGGEGRDSHNNIWDGSTPDTGGDSGSPDAGTDLCALVSCDDGFYCDPATWLCESVCDSTQTYCGGTCVNTNVDPDNCGGCDVICHSATPPRAHVAACTGGACVFECDQGWSDYNSDLASPDSDGCESDCVRSEEVCDGIDNDCNGSTDDGLPEFVYYADSDDDSRGDPNVEMTSCESSAPRGYVANSDDCDDGSNETFPDAPEVCDGFDNDCDGTVDEDLPSYTWWKDEDGDGVGGNSISTASGCVDQAPGPEWVRSSNDCDDQSSSRYPGNREICDGIDNDCDNAIDNGLPLFSYYRDVDGDSWGRDNDVLTSCSTVAPAGRVDQGGDCNDGDSSVYPGAPEACDGVDSDCSGGQETPVDYFIDGDGDGVGGNAIAPLCSGQQPGYSSVGGDCDDNDGRRAPGRPEICDGVDNDCDSATDDSTMCPQTIFVTSTAFFGNVNFPGTADSKCEAAGATVPSSWGNWKAVISTSQYSAAARIRQVGTVSNTNGDLVFGVNEMFNARPRNKVGYFENGTAADGMVLSWTGTTKDGTTSMYSCQGFTSNSSSNHGTVGSPTSTNDGWIDINFTTPCSLQATLMCIDGQD